MATIKTRILLPTKTAAEWESSDRVLSAGELALVTDDKGGFKLIAGDGKTYGEGIRELEAGSTTAHYEVTDLAQLSGVYNNGDTAVVKKILAEGKDPSYTAYVYDGALSAWKAMDGNYSAENVYFENDFTCAGTYTRVGNVTKTETGTATLSAAGKSLKDVIQSIFTERQQPPSKYDQNPDNGNKQPAVSVTAANMKAYEVGTQNITPSWSASLSKGQYKFGPAETGISATSWSVKNNTTSETSASSSGSFNAVTQVTDTTSYQITVSATHDAGAVAYDNLGDPSDPVVQIAAGTKTKSTGTITGFRNTFYGCLTTKGEITSDVIRGLANKTTSKLSNTTLAVGGALRVMIAIPAAKPSGAKGSYNTCNTATLSKILDVNDSNSNLNGQFTKTTVKVEGANGYDAIDYSVYYIDFASAHSTDNFVITQ